MKWEMEKINNTEVYRWEGDGIKAAIEYVYSGFADRMVAYLTISMETEYTYGNVQAHAITLADSPAKVTANKKATLITSYTEEFISVDEAKRKAEELIPVFRIAQSNKII